jgi:hypothetical protein
MQPSIAKCAWLAPKPRIAPQGGLLVYRGDRLDVDVGTRYGPQRVAGGALEHLGAHRGVGAGVADHAALTAVRRPSASQPTV